MSELIELADSVRTVVDSVGLAAAENKVWPHVTELGWLQAGVSEELGGLGLGLPAVCAIQRELGRGLTAVPYAAAMLSIDALCQSSLDDRAKWVGQQIGGGYIATPLVEASVQIMPDSRLTGSASAVPSADRASHVLVCAKDSVVLLSMASVQCQARSTWDETQRLFDITLPAQGVAPERVLATGAAAQALSRRLAIQLDFALAADSVGGAAVLLDMTVEYLQTRKQFGRPLALFQALKHRCADLKASVSAAEALLLGGLEHASSGAGDAVARAMGAKQFACSVYAQVAEEAVQLHGGIGMTAEHPCHLFLKRSQLNEHLGWHRGRYDLGIADSYLNSR